MKQMTLATAALVTIAAFTLASVPAKADETTVATCAATSATGAAFAACMGGAMTAAEAEKWFASGFKDCFGPNNDARKIVERTIVGPVTDIVRGDIGHSDQSVWRKMGLPRIRLW